jgi:hypothetical protein
MRSHIHSVCTVMAIVNYGLGYSLLYSAQTASAITAGAVLIAPMPTRMSNASCLSLKQKQRTHEYACT